MSMSLKDDVMRAAAEAKDKTGLSEIWFKKEVVPCEKCKHYSKLTHCCERMVNMAMPGFWCKWSEE